MIVHAQLSYNSHLMHNVHSHAPYVSVPVGIQGSAFSLFQIQQDY